ncbi:MAG: urease subunit gamma [Nitrososphaeraceae archaeon]
MIYVKAVIKGEDDIPPFIRLFEYPDKSDESIFFDAIKMINEKLARNLKINVNECLMIYCAYVIEQLHTDNSIKSIEENATKVLSVNQVMIGVPETLKKISFEVKFDETNNVQKQIVNINESLPTHKYILAPDP